MCLRPYFDLRDELVVQGNLIFKGPRLVVPACMRKELMSVAVLVSKVVCGGFENASFGL